MKENGISGNPRSNCLGTIFTERFFSYPLASVSIEWRPLAKSIFQHLLASLTLLQIIRNYEMITNEIMILKVGRYLVMLCIFLIFSIFVLCFLLAGERDEAFLSVNFFLNTSNKMHKRHFVLLSISVNRLTWKTWPSVDSHTELISILLLATTSANAQAWKTEIQIKTCFPALLKMDMELSSCIILAPDPSYLKYRTYKYILNLCVAKKEKTWVLAQFVFCIQSVASCH